MSQPRKTAVPRLWNDAARRSDTVLLDGFHALKHALRFHAVVHIAITTDKQAVAHLAQELAPDLAEDLDKIVIELPAEQMRELHSRPHPTDVSALAVRPSRQANQKTLTTARQTPVVLLDNPRNLGNIGAVIRLAAGFGAAGVITTGSVDPWHPNVLRGSAGLHYATAVEAITTAEIPTGPLYALDPEGEDLRTVTIPNDAILAFGSERHGLTTDVRSRADRLLSIPMRPKVSSYNLATSAAMTLYHWLAGQPGQPG